MSDAAVILLLVVLAAGVVISLIRLAARRARNSPAARLPSMALIGADEGLEPPQQTVLSIATERPNEVYLFGPAALLDEYGTVLATTPPQLAKHATRLRGGVDAARSYGELSGRLVLVDDATAAALRSGTMMHDKYGEVLAHVLRDDGKISSVTRLRQVGGLGASLASVANAMSAMAMQAQLDRIERQLSAISHGVEEVHREQLREWHARTLGAQDALREVYGTATRTGVLSASNWAQIATINSDLRTQIHGDRDRLASAIAGLERLAHSKDVSQRVKEVGAAFDAVTTAHAALRESSRAWAQYSTLRLWHLTVVDDPTLGAYREDLEALIASTHEDLKPLRERTGAALRQLPNAHWSSRFRSPFDARRLPTASAGALGRLEGVSWMPFELPPPSLHAGSELEGVGQVDPAEDAAPDADATNIEESST